MREDNGSIFPLTMNAYEMKQSVILSISTVSIWRP